MDVGLRGDGAATADVGEGDEGSSTPADEAPSPRRDWRHPSVEAAVLWLLVAVGLRIGLSPLGDNSFLTHLATGRLILDDHAIPRTDPYSFSAHGHAWTVQSWGASVIYALNERTVGLVGIRLVDAVLCVGLVLLLWRLSRVGTSLVARILVAGLVVSMSTGLWVERPLLFGAFFLAIVLVAAEGELDPRWLVPVMWLWVNIHGSFPFGAGILVLYVIGRWLDDRERPVVELRALGWAVLGTLVGALGPLGPKLLLFPLDLLSNREAFKGIAEWEPPHWQRGVERFFAIQLGLTIVLVLWRDRRWRSILPTVVFGLAAVTSTRNILQASIVLTPILAASLHGLGTIDGTRRPRLARPVVIAVAVLAVLVGVMGVAGPNTALAPYPEDAAAWMRHRGMLGVDDRVVSRDYVGNWLEYEYGPDQVRTYIDDRVDMYPLPVIRDYTQLLAEDGHFQAVLDRARATSVLWDRRTPLGRWLERSERWKVVHRDEKWLVAVPEP
ncbi:hypothetical protein KSP35_02250 [Aquihabitans sp. G128]|uniref:hypothetical protein n=1 Tax=Aquihabitans sp. G128 TaxID=2849779 RepID=UPI001C240945|nr:hypothetical protein [Aquihabitans sp. G128]QXC61689.1 hypothetical protein KSP35_02250 [Aquihabitans sp. G128]